MELRGGRLIVARLCGVVDFVELRMVSGDQVCYYLNFENKCRVYIWRNRCYLGNKLIYCKLSSNRPLFRYSEEINALGDYR